jgi:murein DD-endopeptidase MepM/ murein hydrolase activator NlpD
MNTLKLSLDAIKRAFYSFLRLTFAKRQILFVTNEKIRTVTVGPIAQLCIFFVMAWVANLFYQSLQYNKIISSKSEEVARLKNVTNYFDTEFSSINDRIGKVNDYLISVTGETVPANKQEKEFKIPKNLSDKNLKDSDFETVDKIKEVSSKMDDIEDIARQRIKKIEKTIAMTGLNIKQPHANIAELEKKYPKLKEKEQFGQGGPFIPLENYSASELAIENFSYNKFLNTAKFVDEMDRLITLEKMSRFIPLAKPIKNYFISSGFGARVDPLTKGMAMHQGLDFVGPSHEEIFSPSNGRVILAGSFYDYGQAVVIDHGYGITTRYGHLSKVLVKKGQVVKKGDLLALQGSTGRSTGQHLHYEVRYKNSPLNPRKFIEAGDFLFDENDPEFTNS